MAPKLPVFVATLALIATSVIPAAAAEWYSSDDRWVAYSFRDCRHVRDRYERDSCERFFRPEEAKKDDDLGAAIGVGIVGLAIGAIIAGAAEQDRAKKNERDRWLQYCFAKYRSFDPQTGTFLARDGLRYPCR